MIHIWKLSTCSVTQSCFSPCDNWIFYKKNQQFEFSTKKTDGAIKTNVAIQTFSFWYGRIICKKGRVIQHKEPIMRASVSYKRQGKDQAIFCWTKFHSLKHFALYKSYKALWLRRERTSRELLYKLSSLVLLLQFGLQYQRFKLLWKVRQDHWWMQRAISLLDSSLYIYMQIEILKLKFNLSLVQDMHCKYVRISSPPPQTS